MQNNDQVNKLSENWHTYNMKERIERFKQLPHTYADDFFLSLKHLDQADLIMALPDGERRIWIRLLPPDDLTDVIQHVDEDRRPHILEQLDSPTRKEITALLAYNEDEAGGLMNPRFVRLRPDMTVDEGLRYLRKQFPHVETTRYLYVLDSSQRLRGVISLRTLFAAEGDAIVCDLMRTHLISASETMSQEEITNLFSKSALMAIPVVDAQGKMKGIVTIDDMIEVVEEEATEDMQKLGGLEVLNAPYLQMTLFDLVKKRAGWLVLLFLGEMFTASAMGYFEKEIEKAIVLALFIPLIISSGGNSGSQASTLVVRAIALREVRLRDWWRVFYRELVIGTALGVILGAIGALRILVWPTRKTLYGEHYMLVSATIGFSLIGIVLWGSLCGSMLPFVLKRWGLDPATASAPFVATLVDVSGLVIYFSMASLILKGTML